MLRKLVKNRLIKDMLGSFPKDDETWKVLIVDDDALKIISVSCKLSELLQNNVTVVEQLKFDRQPFPQMSAVYFISPTQASVEKMMMDWATRQRYKDAYLFFTAHVGDRIMDQISRSKMVKYIKGFTELNVDFWALESNVFTLGIENDIRNLWHDKVDAPKQRQFCNLLGQRFSTFFSTIGEEPLIRYQASSQAAESTANFLGEYITKLNKASGSRLKKRKKTICLILDRSVDPLAPLLHEFTYQAMAYDLLNIDVEGIYKHEYTSNGGENDSRTVQLSEDDPIWKKFRHMVRWEALKKLTGEAIDFEKDNADMTVVKKNGEKKSTKEMGRIMHRLGDFKKSQGQYALHINLLKKRLLQMHKDLKLDKLGELEQDMAVGENANGEKIGSNILKKFGPLFKSMDEWSTLRLVLIYFITQEMKDSQREQILRMSDFDELDADQFIENIQKLGIEFKKKGGLLKSMKGLLSKKKSSNIEEGTWTLCRYTPKVKELGELLIKGKLDTKSYPYVSNEPGMAPKLSSGAPQSTSKSSRSKRKKPKWASRNKKKEKQEEEEDNGRQGGYQLVVLMLGGATYSEMRSVYELDKAYNINVMLGGTSLVTPKTFLQRVGKLSDN